MVYLMGDVSLSELRENLIQIKSHDFVFIDEAHNLEPKCQELLYPAIDNQKVPRLKGKAQKKNAPEEPPFADIKSCTIVLATDQPGKLQNALKKRMGIIESLERYSSREMQEIVDHLARELNLLISPQARNRIAKVSLGIPRKAQLHLKNLRRHYLDCERTQLTTGQVRRYFRDFEIDAKGLNRMDRKYMRYLARHGKASQESLALHLGVDVDHVRREIESVLQQIEFLVIGSGGRQLTEQGVTWINKSSQTNDNNRSNK